MPRARSAAAPAPPPLTAEETARQAEAEGLTLLKSEGSRTGYKGVTFSSRSNNSKPYQVRVGRRGKQVFLGYYATAEEGALCYARSPEGRAAAAAPPAPPEPPPMTAEEALWQAEAEGLTLLKSERSSTGYKYVHYDSSKDLTTPYRAQVWRGGKLVKLGYFATAEEAALHVARTAEGLAAVAAAAAAPPKPPPLTAEKAVQQAEAEGLTLLRSESNSSGYKGVSFIRSSDKSRPYQAQVQPRGSCKSKPYQAKVWRGGTVVHLGLFATAEEAALCYARSPEAQAAAAAPPPTTAEEALQQAEAEGLTLLRSESNNSGYKGVSFKGSRNLAKPYTAEVRRGGKDVHLGRFATAEEAALCYARASARAQAAAPQPPAASSRKRKAESEEQPPDEPVDVVVILEGRFVEPTPFE